VSVTALLGKKLSMTQIWDEQGNCLPVTVLQAGPCQVVQVKAKDGKDGYEAVQIGFDELPARNGGKGDARVNKPLQGHFKRNGADPKRRLREVPLDEGTKAPEPGTVLKVEDIFKDVTKVDIVGTSKGRGFQGCIKRHNFQRGPKTHGSKNYREPGSTGPGTTPGHQIKGLRLPGQMGNKRRTVRNLRVVKIEPEHDLIYVKGAVPGPRGGYVLIRKALRPGKK
jgi:large subunit ribosomal protein L3